MESIGRICTTVMLASIVGLVACSGSAPPPAAPPAPPANPAPQPPPVAASAASAAPAPLAAVEAAPKEPPHWKYEGAEGPEKWGELWPDWAKCKTGVEQSPIDLPKKGDKPEKAVALAPAYGKLPLEIMNNGHTVQVSAAQGGKFSFAGVEYTLAQFHLHAPSEHTIAGAKFDGELHLVHKNAKGEISVVGILLKKGKENKILAPVFAAAPAEESHEAKPVANVSVDLASLVPAKSAYYSYPGSLTTPPCSEGVKWFVLTKPIEISEAQLKKFQDVMHGGNARPVLPLGARKVAEVHP
jgi:carbonic anhydrase